MAKITAALVKELREKSGGGMMDCKKALTATDGDLDAAIDWLREKGLATAAKKSGRVAAEGLVAVVADGAKGAMIELNAETDFVARNDQFQALANGIAVAALANEGDIDKVQAADFVGSERNVADEITNAIATIGENMNLRRTVGMDVGEGVVACYMHNATADGLGKLGILVGLKSAGDAAKLAAFGKQLAMHVAATNPASLSQADLDPAVVDREKKVLTEQAIASGKPAEIAEKMVIGRMQKFFKEVCLLEQTFVIDGESQVKKAVEAAAKDAGAPIEVVGFERFALGEGIEKEETDFAAEVAAATGG